MIKKLLDNPWLPFVLMSLAFLSNAAISVITDTTTWVSLSTTVMFGFATYGTFRMGRLIKETRGLLTETRQVRALAVWGREQQDLLHKCNACDLTWYGLAAQHNNYVCTCGGRLVANEEDT